MCAYHIQIHQHMQIYVLWPAVSIHVHGSCITQFGLKLGGERPLVSPPSSKLSDFGCQGKVVQGATSGVAPV